MTISDCIEVVALATGTLLVLDIILLLAERNLDD